MSPPLGSDLDSGVTVLGAVEGTEGLLYDALVWVMKTHGESA